MITLIVLFVSGILIGYLIQTNSQFFSEIRILGRIVGMLLGGGLGLMISALLIIGVGTSLPGKYVLDEKIQLTPVQEKEGPSMFVGFDTKNKEYVYWVKEGSGFQVKSVSVEDSLLESKKRKDGIIEIYQKKFPQTWLSLFIPPFGERRKIFVPKLSKVPDLKFS